MTVQLLPDNERFAMLQALGASPDEARLIDEHALAEARRAFDYGLKVVRTLTPARVHHLAAGAYAGAMRFLIDEWRSGVVEAIGETRQ